KGRAPIDDHFYEYFQANQTTSVYSQAVPREPAGASGHVAESTSAGGTNEAEVKNGLMEELSIWILAPLIFFFLGFDNGQMRRYFIGLVPNRYFELSLTVMDILDDAIGK